MKAKFVKFWKKAKAVAIPAVTLAATLAAQGTFGPKAAAVAAGIGAIWGVFSKRPQDPHSDAEARQAAQALLRLKAFVDYDKRRPVIVPASRRDQ